MKIAVDTNVLVRGVVADDLQQAQAATQALRQASLIAVSLPCLCEFVWVLRSVYGFDAAAIASAIHALMATEKVATDRPAVEAGLAVLQAGGDFADGIMAQQGQSLGAKTFISFDKKAVSLLKRLGQAARLP